MVIVYRGAALHGDPGPTGKDVLGADAARALIDVANVNGAVLLYPLPGIVIDEGAGADAYGAVVVIVYDGRAVFACHVAVGVIDVA